MMVSDLKISLFGLGVLLQERQKSDEAIAAFREALRLRPDYQEARDQLLRLIR